MTLFSVGEEPNHHIGDVQCPECWEEYPERCRCGRSEDQLDET